MKILPAILENSFEQIENKAMMVFGLVDMVQVDICDGMFVPSVTFGWEGGREAATLMNLLEKHNLQAELDFMTDFKNNQSLLDNWLVVIQSFKPKRVIFHFESIRDWQYLFDAIDERSTEIYMAVHLNNDTEEVLRLYEQYNFKGIQVMGIEHVGFSGEVFHHKALEYIQIFSRQGITVSVDGGIKLENAQRIADAGASAVGVNSGLFAADDIGMRLSRFKNIIPGHDPLVLI